MQLLNRQASLPSTSGRPSHLPSTLPLPHHLLSVRQSRRLSTPPSMAARVTAAALPVHLYDLAEAAAAVSDQATNAAVQKSGGGWLAPLTTSLEELLRVLQTGLNTLHVPYSYGYSIILLTLIVKTATYPLTKQQVESTLAVQSLKPRIDLIKARYGEDQDKISKETSVLYEQAGVNPLAGCLPTIATIPIFIGLYSSLTNAANQGLFDTEGFYFLPSLAGPTTIAARQAGSSTSWLFPLVDGAPASGWDQAGPYLVLPVLLVLAQYVSTAIISPPLDPEDKNANVAKVLNTFLPLMVGWFALNVPSGLALYYLSNTVVSTGQQVYLRKLGGAQIKVNDLGPVTKPGSGRRLGMPATDLQPWKSQVVAAVAAREAAELEDNDEEAAPQDQLQQEQQLQQQALAASANGAPASAQQQQQPANRFVKRKRLDRMAKA